MKELRNFTLGILIALTNASAAFAWGRQGHTTVALVAEGLLTPAAKQMVDQLRRAPGWEIFKPGDSRYFKKANEELDSVLPGAGWGLEPGGGVGRRMAGAAPGHGTPHYVNTPLSGDGSHDSMATACADNCILTELDKEIVILDDKEADPGLRMQALLWVVHLVGDVHQPLHCTDNGDKGGNMVGVFVGGRVENLHSAWDADFSTWNMRGRRNWRMIYLLTNARPCRRRPA